MSGNRRSIWHRAAERTNRQLYPALNPADSFAFADKVALLAARRCLCPRARSARRAGDRLARRRLAGCRDPARRRRGLSRHPPARAVQCQRSWRATAANAGNGSHGFGGRGDLSATISIEKRWQAAVREAVRQSLVGTRGQAGTGRRDGCRARARLARHPAA